MTKEHTLGKVGGGIHPTIFATGIWTNSSGYHAAPLTEPIKKADLFVSGSGDIQSMQGLTFIDTSNQGDAARTINHYYYDGAAVSTIYISAVNNAANCYIVKYE